MTNTTERDAHHTLRIPDGGVVTRSAMPKQEIRFDDSFRGPGTTCPKEPLHVSFEGVPMGLRITRIILGGVIAGVGTSLHSWAGAVLVTSGVIIAACAAGER